MLLAAAAATDRLGRMFGQSQPLGPSITALAPGIEGVNITPASSLHEYGLKVLRSELITRAVFENRAVRGLLGAIPGLDAYALLGKAWWHTTETKRGTTALRLGRVRRARDRPRRADAAHPAGDSQRDAQGTARGRRARHHASCCATPRGRRW